MLCKCPAWNICLHNKSYRDRIEPVRHFNQQRIKDNELLCRCREVNVRWSSQIIGLHINVAQNSCTFACIIIIFARTAFAFASFSITTLVRIWAAFGHAFINVLIQAAQDGLQKRWTATENACWNREICRFCINTCETRAAFKGAVSNFDVSFWYQIYIWKLFLFWNAYLWKRMLVASVISSFGISELMNDFSWK